MSSHQFIQHSYLIVQNDALLIMNRNLGVAPTNLVKGHFKQRPRLPSMHLRTGFSLCIAFMMFASAHFENHGGEQARVILLKDFSVESNSTFAVQAVL